MFTFTHVAQIGLVESVMGPIIYGNISLKYERSVYHEIYDIVYVISFGPS